jgi:hypothetical protein
VKRLLLALAPACAVLALTAAPALATNECRGLQVCVPVVGPWVVVPTGSGVARPTVQYQLSCPKGFVVGGLDAELSDRRIDVHFQAMLGSPVNPGISTSRVALFTGTYVGPGAPAATFRPHIGCLPAAGGGVRVPTAVGPFPVGQPTVWHVKDVRLKPGSQRATQSCASGETLVGASHAIGFYLPEPPPASSIRQVAATRSIQGGTVVADVRAGSTVTDIRTVVQVGALCAGGK